MASAAWTVLVIALATPALAGEDTAIRDLASSDLAVRRKAVGTLARLPALPAEAIAPLVERLRDPDLVVADTAARALGHGGAAARAAVEPLLGSSGPKFEGGPWKVVGLLVASDPDAWPLVLRAFRDDGVRDHVAGAVASLRAQAVPGLIEALGDEDARVRLGAAHALEWIGPDAQAAIPPLVRSLSDGDPSVRRAAAFALARIDPAGRDAVPLLIEALPDYRAACTLAALGQPPAAAVAGLVDTMLHGPNELEQSCAATALEKVGVGDPAVERALITALEEGKSGVRFAAASALGARGVAAIPPLTKALGNDNPAAREVAAEKLAKIGTPAVPALASALASDDVYVRQAAAGALAGMDRFPDAATDALIRALDDRSGQVRDAASRVLARARTRRVKEALARYAREEEQRENTPPSATDGVFSKDEIVATRPPEGDYRYPFELESLAPIPASDLVVSTYRGRDRGGEIDIWAKVDGGYRRLDTFVEDPAVGSYDPLTWFHYGGGGRLFLVLSERCNCARFAATERIFAVEQSAGRVPTLTEVEVESPVEWFRRQLGPDEEVWDGPSLSFADGRLEWEFPIWRPGDCHAGPTGGSVHGTFDLYENRHHDDTTDRWTSTWRMVVRDGHREANARPATAPRQGQIQQGAGPSVISGALLPGRPPSPPQ